MYIVVSGLMTVRVGVILGTRDATGLDAALSVGVRVSEDVRKAMGCPVDR